MNGCGLRSATRRCGSGACWWQLLPGESEVHALLALMELQASRTAARRGQTGEAVYSGPGPLFVGLRADSARNGRARTRAKARRWREKTTPCRQPLPHVTRAPAPPQRPTGSASFFSTTLCCRSAVAHRGTESRSRRRYGARPGRAAGLHALDALAGDSALAGYHLFPSVRGDLLMKMGRSRRVKKSNARWQ